MALATRHWQRGANPALTMTELGFGSAPLGNLYKAISDADADAALDAAWSAGIRVYDTAPLYGFGLAETRLNRFLRDKPRDSYVLSSKIGRLLSPATATSRDGIGKFFDVPNRREVFDYSYDGTMRSVEFSLERLGVDRIDILLAHDLDIFTHGSAEARDTRLSEFMAGGHEALIQLRQEGVIAAFGAGVNEWQACQWLIENGDPDIFLLAGRYTLLEQEALNTFLPICEAREIGIILGGPYNSGILAGGTHYNYDPAPADIVERVARIEAICTDHGVRLIDAAFRFPLLHPSVVTCIPGAQSRDEVLSNLRAAQAVIPPALWPALKDAGLLHQDAPIDL